MISVLVLMFCIGIIIVAITVGANRYKTPEEKLLEDLEQYNRMKRNAELS